MSKKSLVNSLLSSFILVCAPSNLLSAQTNSSPSLVQRLSQKVRAGDNSEYVTKLLFLGNSPKYRINLDSSQLSVQSYVNGLPSLDYVDKGLDGNIDDVWRYFPVFNNTNQTVFSILIAEKVQNPLSFQQSYTSSLLEIESIIDQNNSQ